MGPNNFMLIWTTFGFADDDDDMVAHRLRQNNMFGPGGFIGIDDNEAIKFLQDGLVRSVPRHGLAPLGKDTERRRRGDHRSGDPKHVPSLQKRDGLLMAGAQPRQASIETDPARMRELRFRIEDFHSDYADVLDRGEIATWPDFFTDDGVYRLMARDNADANLPLSLISCEGKGMFKDRAYAIEHTEMFAPRYTLHQISQIRITGVQGNLVRARANYVIYETLIDEPTRVLQCGKYVDQFDMSGPLVLLRERLCIYDTVLVPTCIVYPP